MVFVSDAIPGERVRARVIAPQEGADASTRSFWRAETIEVLDASEHRRPHIWAEADLSRDPADRPAEPISATSTSGTSGCSSARC